MSWKKVKLGDVLKQYRIEHRVDDNAIYKQVSILNDGSVVLRGEKNGKEIGRKRQFIIDTRKYPHTLIFTRQLLLQGSIGIASDDVHSCIVTENMPMFSIDTSKIDKEFLILFLKSEVFKSRIREIELSGSAQKSIHERTFLNLEFSLPSFHLQKEMVVELVKLKGNLGEIYSELSNQRTLVKKLRQQLLQDAVQGKLVKQNKKDEPASELLKKIKAEKQKLIAEKKLKKEKELPPIKPEEIPFEIPENWSWCRLGDLCTKIGSGSTPKGSNYSSMGKPFFRSQNIYDSGLVYEDIKYISDEVHKQMKGTTVFANDILLNITGGSMGRCALVLEDFEEGNVSQHVCIIRPILVINKFYHSIALSPFFQKFVFSSTTGAGREGLPKYNLEQFLIPIPPLAEQNRIVEKLDELMQHCNELEASIKQSESQNEKLLQQVLSEALRKEPILEND